MELHPVGNTWLQYKYRLQRITLLQHSFIASRDTTTWHADGTLERTFGPKYEPDTHPLAHVEFALKHERLNLDFLQAVFRQTDPAEVKWWIDQKPAGRYRRKLCYYFEMLTGQVIEPAQPMAGNYTDLLDETQYLAGNSEKVAKWRINNNLPGTASFCPVVWRTPLLHAKLSYQHTEHLQNLRNRFAPELFYRAVQYLYTKETRSSYSIERESPSTERVNRFVTLLQQAGKAPLAQLLTEENLVLFQQEILEPRFAAKAFRDFQNYVGQSLPNFQELVHYLCPPPDMLTSLMQGLQSMLQKTTAMHPVARAAMASFGLVFAHPFEDGNGRLHRFLIHDLLMRGGLVPAGMIVPVSAHMLKYLAEYDKILEAYSRPLMQRVQYRKKPDGDLEILNPADIEGYYRFPDLTLQATYLAQVVEKTIEVDMVQELEFLQRYDALKLDIQAIADMPDKKIDMLIALLHQNHGRLANRKRQLFDVLTDAEIAAIEGLYDEVFAAPRETG